MRISVCWRFVGQKIVNAIEKGYEAATFGEGDVCNPALVKRLAERPMPAFIGDELARFWGKEPEDSCQFVAQLFDYNAEKAARDLMKCPQNG